MRIEPQRGGPGGGRVAVAVILVAWCALVVVSWPAVQAFVGNDDDQWLEWARQPLSKAVGPGTPYSTYRPAFAALLVAEVRVFGDWLPGYRLAGLAFHLAASFFVLGCARRVLDEWSSLAVASVFLLSGVHHETLFWIAGLPDTLAGTAVLAALWFHLRSRTLGRTGWAFSECSAAVFAFLGALFKETGLIVLVVVPLAAAAAGSVGGRRIREAARALLVVSPALVSLALYAAFATGTGRLANALVQLPERPAWTAAGVASLVWPLPLQELRVAAQWWLRPAGRALVVLAAGASLLGALWVARRALAGPAGRVGLVLLAAGLVPFLLLPQHRLLYLAPAGLAMIVLSTRPRAIALGVAVALCVTNLLALRQFAWRWNTAGEVGRAVLVGLRDVADDRILLVDLPLDVGEVLTPTGVFRRLAPTKRVQILAPLRRDDFEASPSRISIEEGRIVVRRPIRWGDHLCYPCDATRMRQDVVRVRIGPCRADAPQWVGAAVEELRGAALYRYEGGRLVRWDPDV